MGSTRHRDELPPEIEDAVFAVLDVDPVERAAAIERFLAAYPEQKAALESALRDAALLAAGGSDAIAQRLARLRARGSGDDRYVEIAEIGRGGMGVVHRIRDLDLERDLAMKVVREHSDRERSGVSVDPDVVERFLDEALITGQLQHPSIVPLHDLGVDANGRPWFTMRLVPGTTAEVVFARARENRDGWNLARALDVLLKVCDAVAFAHARHVLHRDLKPANVMVGEFGEVYVMDWGLAKVIGAPDKRDLRVRTASSDDAAPLVTLDGAVIGTPCFMSPEQAHGSVALVGPATDVYALGAMLYELLAGTRPYVAPGTQPTQKILLDAVRAGPPEPIEVLAPATPPELVSICAKAMARRIEDRYASVRALADDLRRFVDARVVLAHRTGAFAELFAWTRRNRALAWAVVGLVVVTLAGFAAIVALGRTNARAAIEQAAAQRDLLALASASREAERDPWRALAILAEVPAATPRATDAARVALDVLARLPAAWRVEAVADFGPSPVVPLKLVAEGTLVVAGVDSSSWVGAIDGLTSVGRVPYLVDPLLARVVAGDGVRLCGIDPTGVQVVDLRTGAVLRRLVLDGVGSAAFDAAGEHILIASERLALDLWSPADPDGARLELPIPSPFTVSAGFDRSGRHVAVAVEGGDVLLFDLTRPFAPRRWAVGSGGVASLAFSPDGEALVAADERGAVRAWSVRGDVPERALCAHAARPIMLAFDARGDRVFSAASDGTVLVTAVATGVPLGRVDFERAVVDVAVAPNGGLFAAALEDGGIVVMRSGVSGRVVLNGHRARVRQLAFTPDGERLVSAADDGTVRVWRRSVAAGTIGHDASAFGWWPDGTGVVAALAGGALELSGLGSGRVVTVSAPASSGGSGRIVRVLGAHGDAVAVLDDQGGLRVVGVPDGREVFARVGVTDVGVTTGGGFGVVDSGRVVVELDAAGAELSRHALPDGARVFGMFDGAAVGVTSGGSIEVWSPRGDVGRCGTAQPDLGVAACVGEGLAFVTELGAVRVAVRDRPAVDLPQVRGDVVELCASANGARLVARTRDGALWSWSLDGSDAQPSWLDGGVRADRFQVAPDGARVVGLDAAGAMRIWELDWPRLHEIVAAVAPRFVRAGGRR